VSDERSWRRFGPESAERAALLALGTHLGVSLRPEAIELEPGMPVEVEGATADHALLLQVNLNRAAHTSQQRNKVLADLFKLRWLVTTRYPGATIGLLLNENTSEAFRPRSWTYVATRELGIVLYVLDPDGGIREL
jgi:hypothetical protein